MLKREISKAPALAYYNPRKETVLQTDASIKGLGACLLQEGETCIFCQQSTNRDTEGIHGNSCMGSQKVPALPI